MEHQLKSSDSIFKTKEKIMRKSYKYRLYPNKIIKTIIDKNLEVCRWLYNYFHEKRIEVWEENKTRISYTQQQNLLPSLKKVHPFLKKVQSQILQDVVRRLDKANITKQKIQICSLSSFQIFWSLWQFHLYSKERPNWVKA